MRNGDFYNHYKNNEYFFDCIALPADEKRKRTAEHIGVARYHENTHDLDLYFENGVTFIDSDVPHTIYQAEQDYDTTRVWAREVDDFFGCKELPGGSHVKRFTIKETAGSR